MTNPSGRKGAYWEDRLARYLKDALGMPIERRVQGGTKDRGDISGIPGVVIEAKNEKRWDIPRYVREAHAEGDNDLAEWRIAMIPYRGHGVGKGFAIVDIDQMIEMLRRLQNL